MAPADEQIGPCETRGADLAKWLAWLDTFEPTTAKIVDLYCVADLSVKEAAAATGLSKPAVARKLREAFAMLKSRAALDELNV